MGAGGLWDLPPGAHPDDASDAPSPPGRAEGPPPVKTVMLLTTMFFPHPVVAAVRMTQLARHLPEYGWRPLVVTRFYGYMATEEQLRTAGHTHTRVIYLDSPHESDVPAVDTGRRSRPALARSAIARSRPLRLAVPDASIVSWRRFRPRLGAIVEAERPDVLLTTAPPFSQHDAGMWLKQRFGTPWIADYRDPYLIDYRFGLAGSRRLRAGAHRAFDRAVHERADLVLHNIPVQSRWARLAYPRSRHRMRLVLNACATGLAEGRVEPALAPDGVRSVRIVGLIGDAAAVQVARAIAALREGGVDAELRLVGNPPPNQACMRRLLGERLVVTGRVSHEEALRQVAGADVLVNALTAQRARAHLISSKCFEYIAAGKPILAINPTNSDRRLLRRVPLATLLSEPDDSQVVGALRRMLEEPPPAEAAAFAARFRREHSWRIRAGEVARLLDELVPVDRPTA